MIFFYNCKLLYINVLKFGIILENWHHKKKMKQLLCILFYFFSGSTGNAQGNWVASGSEVVNFSVVDIAAIGGIGWSSERGPIPGYFSATDTAAYTGCSDAANIDGYLKKYGNNAFIFPVGSGDKLRSLEISAPANLTDTYATAWITGNPTENHDPTSPNAGAHPVSSVSFPIASVSTVGQWDWQVGDADHLGPGTTGTGEGLTIKVSIPDMTLFATATSLRLVGWNGTTWIDLSETSTASGNTENSTLTGTMVPNITAIAIGRIASALPLKLESFTASSSNCNTVLNWKTSSEINTNKFIVEQSFDAVHFTTLIAVAASGPLYGNRYSTTVAQPYGIAYYRLKIYDNDGSYIYSQTVSYRNNCTASDQMQVYPNPVSAYENIYLNFTTSFRGQADFIIFNSISQRVLSKKIQVTEGKNLIATEVLKLTAGTYFIRLIGADGKQIGTVQKFIKQ